MPTPCISTNPVELSTVATERFELLKTIGSAGTSEVKEMKFGSVVVLERGVAPESIGVAFKTWKVVGIDWAVQFAVEVWVAVMVTEPGVLITR